MPVPRTSWRDVLLHALDQDPGVAVMRVVERHLKRRPTRAELSAARRAAGRLAETGQARLVTLPIRTRSGRRGHLVLIRLGDTVTKLDLKQMGIAAAPVEPVSPAAQRVARLLERIRSDAARVAASIDGLTDEEQVRAREQINEAAALLREASQP